MLDFVNPVGAPMAASIAVVCACRPHVPFAEFVHIVGGPSLHCFCRIGRRDRRRYLVSIGRMPSVRRRTSINLKTGKVLGAKED